MNQRDVNLDQYEISSYAFRELKYFCLQYHEKKALAKDLMDLSATSCDGMPHGSGVSNPTERKAIVAARLLLECAQIEQAASVASEPGCYRYLIANVTTGAQHKDLSPPCGKNQFTGMRRRFFYELAKKRGWV